MPPDQRLFPARIISQATCKFRIGLAVAPLRCDCCELSPNRHSPLHAISTPRGDYSRQQVVVRDLGSPMSRYAGAQRSHDNAALAAACSHASLNRNCQQQTRPMLTCPSLAHDVVTHPFSPKLRASLILMHGLVHHSDEDPKSCIGTSIDHLVPAADTSAPCSFHAGDRAVLTMPPTHSQAQDPLH